MLDINGLGTFVADEMIIQPEMARGDPDRPIIVGRIYNFSITGSNIASMTIGDEIVIPVPPCVDTDGDMLVGTSDLLGLLAAWGSSDPAYDIAPAGGDGVVGTQDLLLLLAEWGPCPIE